MGDAHVIVVGAGPGGSTAAAALAGRGRDVLLLEAQAFPRDKVCGDVLLPELDLTLCAIGTSLMALAADAHEIHGCRYTTPRGRRVTGRFADRRGFLRPWRILPRRIFDERLVRHAERRGARLLERHRVLDVDWDGWRGLNYLRVRTPSGERVFRAPLLIGADGATSVTARCRGLGHVLRAESAQRGVAFRGYVPWQRNQGRFEVIVSRRLLPGCAWIVPGPDGRANVGVGALASDLEERSLRLSAELERLLGDRVPLERLEGAAGWSLPGGFGGGPVVADGLLLVGDAAGLVDPFTGHGIHTACASGLMAAEAAHEALRRCRLQATSGPLAAYQRLLRDGLGRDLRTGRWLQRLHSRPILVELAVLLASRSRRLADRAMGLVGHTLDRDWLRNPHLVMDLLEGDANWPPSRPSPWEGRV